jgi:PAS domain S-box-containing protein
MMPVRLIDDTRGRLFAVEGDRDGLAETAGDAALRDRLDAVASGGAGPDAIQAVLQLGADWLAVEQGFLARIDVAAGTHTIAEVSGAPATTSEGETRGLSTTYCRTVLAENATLAVHDAPAQGWEADPAYEAFGARTYLGTKVVVDGAFYGTLCFVDREARGKPFDEAQAAAAGLLGQTVGRLLADAPPDRPSRPTAAQLEALFEHAPNMVNIHDEDGNLIAPNPSLCEKTGYTRDELTGMKVWELDRAAQPEQARALWADMAPGDRARWEGTYQRKDGTSFPVEVDLRRLAMGGTPRFIATGRDITERKAAERALKEEHDFLNRILETSPAAIVVFDAEGTFVEASGRAENVLGLDRDAITGRTYNDPEWDLRGPDGGPVPDEELPFARVMATGAPVHDVEHRIAWPDGTERLLSVSGAPLHAPDGELEGAVFHVDDITEHRAAKAALQDERDQFATLFHNLPTPVVHGAPNEDGTLRVEAVNERFETVFGYDEDAIRGADLQHLIVPDDERSGAEAMREHLLAGEPVDREVQRHTVEGRRDFRVQVALRDGEDGPTDGFAIYTDVTERKRRERALARRQALLAAQAEATLDGLLAVDNDRHAVFFNDRFLEVWDLPADVLDERRPSTPAEYALLTASDLLPDPEAFRNEVEHLYDHPDQESRDVVQLTDGRWIDRYSAPIVGDDGNRFGRLWVFRDVTEQRRMMKRLLEVQEEERRRIDQEIHDEMGGLLTSLQFTVDLARRAAQNDDASAEQFDRLEALVSELSSVSRTISRKLYPSALAERGLAEAFRDLVDEMENEHDLDIDLRSEIEPGNRFSVPVERTVYWIAQEALMSVVRQEEVEAVQVIVNERDEQLYLHFFDEGDELSAATGGRGTGLRFEAIRRRVEWLGGEIRLTPIPGEGMRLSISVPVRRPLRPR